MDRTTQDKRGWKVITRHIKIWTIYIAKCLYSFEIIDKEDLNNEKQRQQIGTIFTSLMKAQWHLLLKKVIVY